MVARDVQRLEVEVVGLDLGPLDDREAEAGEDRDDLVVDAREGVERAAGRAPPRQREIEPLARARGAALRLERPRQTRVQEGLELALGRVRRGADARPLFGREGAERAEELGQDALAAEEPDADLLKLGGGLRGGDGLTRFLRDRVDARIDRKSTRLNSSHLVISYAVFCLKKKKIARHSS